MQFVLDMLAGAATGVITGFGIGGGTLLIIYLTMFRGTSQVAAQGVNLLYFLPTAGCALISHIKNRCIVWRAVIIATCAGVITTVIAAIIATRIDTDVLRRIFGGFLIIIGISELFGKKE